MQGKKKPRVEKTITHQNIKVPDIFQFQYPRKKHVGVKDHSNLKSTMTFPIFNISIQVDMLNFFLPVLVSRVDIDLLALKDECNVWHGEAVQVPSDLRITYT